MGGGSGCYPKEGSALQVIACRRILGPIAPVAISPHMQQELVVRRSWPVDVFASLLKPASVRRVLESTAASTNGSGSGDVASY